VNKKYLIAIIAVASAALALAAFLGSCGSIHRDNWFSYFLAKPQNRNEAEQVARQDTPDEAIEQCFGAGPIWG